MRVERAPSAGPLAHLEVAELLFRTAVHLLRPVLGRLRHLTRRLLGFLPHTQHQRLSVVVQELIMLCSTGREVSAVRPREHV